MQQYLQQTFKYNPKAYDQLKENSYYIKELNRGTLNFKDFINNMNVIYKERPTDKINNIISNMELIGSILDILQ